MRDFCLNTINTISPKYHLLSVLGRGATGVTYLSENKQTKQKVAIKCLSLKNLQNWQQIKLFEREITVLKHINHPVIPKYLDHFEIESKSDHYFCLVQELAPGKSLAELVQAGWRGTEAEIQDIAQQLLKILSYLHKQEPPIIHRDLKPNNIIRDADGKIYLVDFGAVQQIYYTTITGDNTVVGTFGYTAPEQFYGKTFAASDLYSLGATILYLLTHTCPTEFATDGLKIQFQDKVNVSNSFRLWLEKMLEPELEQRFQSANIALAALQGKENFLSNHKNQSRFKNLSFLLLFMCFLLLLNSQKWLFLSRVGILPKNICNSQVMKKYLKQGGDPNIFRDTIDSSSRVNEYCRK